MVKRILNFTLTAIILFIFFACNSSENEKKATEQEKSSRELGRQMAEELKQPIIDAEAAKQLSQDHLKKIEDATKE